MVLFPDISYNMNIFKSTAIRFLFVAKKKKNRRIKSQKVTDILMTLNFKRETENDFIHAISMQLLHVNLLEQEHQYSFLLL